MARSSTTSSRTQRDYLHPPIIDAVIELRFSDDLAEDKKHKISDKLAPDYELVEDLTSRKFSFSMDLAVGAESVSTKSEIIDRLIKRSKVDHPHVVQIGSKTLTISGQAPYEGWQSLHARFNEAWNKAKPVWGFRKIERIGVRYINRLDLKLDQDARVSHEEYLNLHINVPEEFSTIGDYELNFNLPLDDIASGATIRSGVVPPAVPGRASFLLDVDVWREIDVPQKESDVDAYLMIVRHRKNELFEAFITDKARKLFDAS